MNFIFGIAMQKRQIRIGLLRLILLCLPISCLADGIRKVDFAEYMDKVKALNSTCRSKGMSSFSGFCLSQEFGKDANHNPTQTSITLGLEIASFEHFYSGCEHSNVPSASDVLVRVKKVFEAAKYSEEIRPQKDALENYVGRFYFCKTKLENDATVLNRLKWFEEMSGKYSSGMSDGNRSASNFVVGNVSTKFAATIDNEILSLTCNGTSMLDTACLVRIGTSGSAQPVKFVTQTTRYSHLLRKGIEKALTSEQSPRMPSGSDIPLLRELAVDQCHPAAESQGMSGDLLQLCIPSNSSKIVLFIRGLCDRCEFEPLILERQVSP